MEILHSLRLRDTLQKDQLLRAIRGAAARRASAAYVGNLITTSLFSIPLAIIVTIVAITQSEFQSGSSAGILLSNYVVGGGVASGLTLTPLAAVTLTYFLFPSIRRLFEKLTLYTLFGAAIPVFLFFAVTTWGSGSNPPGMDMKAASSGALAMSGIILTVTGSLAFSDWLTKYFDARWCHPYDLIALFLLGMAASIHRGRHRWYDDNKIAEWRAGLEIVAAQVERDAPLSRRVGTAEGGSRTELRDEARRIGAVVRNHKRAIAEAQSTDNVNAVVVSLVHGTQAFCAGDRAALLANAPDRVTPQVNRFAATTLRLIPAAVLVTAGIFLPLVPAIAYSDMASNLRWYLITMGAIMFITTRQDLATKIGEAVARVLFR